MRYLRTVIYAFSIVGLTLMLPACGGASKEEAVVQIRYEFDADKGLPPGLTSLAVAPMECDAPDEDKWQEIATEMMHRKIAVSNEKNNLGLTLADRKNAQKIIEEKDAIRAGLVEGTAAQEAAKLVGVQALVMGRVIIKVEVHKGKGSTVSAISGFAGRYFGGGSASSEERESISRNVTVQVTFRLLDSANGKDWFSWTPDKPFMVSDKKKPGPFFGSSKTEADLTPRDMLVAQCVEEAVTEFVSHLMPTDYEFALQLESSSNENCALGVQRIRAEDFEGAAASLKQAIAEDPQDGRALFALGVVQEVTGDYENALVNYRNACAIENMPEYLEARDRVKNYKDRVKKG
jgi:hypothetical protein